MLYRDRQETFLTCSYDIITFGLIKIYRKGLEGQKFKGRHAFWTLKPKKKLGTFQFPTFFQFPIKIEIRPSDPPPPPFYQPSDPHPFC